MREALCSKGRERKKCEFEREKKRGTRNEREEERTGKKNEKGEIQGSYGS